ncbi:MAG: SEC-C metal-binding domain-containing protein [Polyangiales bacterium]
MNAASTTPADTKIGRNDPCHCGSGQKYKKCCSAKDDAARSAELAAQAAARAERARVEREQAEAEGKTPEKTANKASDNVHKSFGGARAVPGRHGGGGGAAKNLPRRKAV